MKTTIVIPSYNEMRTLPAVLKALSGLALEKEVIVVDDGSGDGTREWLDKVISAKEFPYELKIIKHEKNTGKGGALLTAGAAASILGTAGNTVLSGPRYLYALARDGYGPSFLARLHPRYLTPVSAIVLQTAVVLPLALSGSFAGLAALSVVARLASYISTAASIPVLRKKLPDTPATVRLPFGPAIPIAAVLVSAFLVASATAVNLLAGAAALVAGLVVFVLRRKG